MSPKLRLLLLNPNTNAGVTQLMLAIARSAAPPGTVIEGITAPFGARLITTEPELARAAEAVRAMVLDADTSALDGIMIAAFGDPGLDWSRALAACPVTGIAEASMAEAVAQGPFAVVTTTPDLCPSITDAARRYGHGALFRGVRVTPGDAAAVMADPGRLEAALLSACLDAVAQDGVAALIIGGGPLAAAAAALRGQVPVPLIEPVPAAIRAALSRAYRLPLWR